MGKVNGKTLVAIAVSATFCAVGFATVYLPFFADKDKIRGMNENADTEAKKEMERYLKTNAAKEESAQAGSMWKNMAKK